METEDGNVRQSRRDGVETMWGKESLGKSETKKQDRVL